MKKELKVKALGDDNPTHEFRVTSFKELMELKRDIYDEAEPGPGWTEWGRDAFEKDEHALLRAIEAVSQGQTVLQSEDEDGDYFFVVAKDGDIVLRSDDGQSYEVAACEDCGSIHSLRIVDTGSDDERGVDQLAEVCEDCAANY